MVNTHKEYIQLLESELQRRGFAEFKDNEILAFIRRYQLDKRPGMLELACEAHSNVSGITLCAYTTQPGMQLYTGNYLDGAGTGKDGRPFQNHQAFCLETQHFPCTPSHPEFPPIELLPGGEYHETTAYAFSAQG